MAGRFWVLAKDLEDKTLKTVGPFTKGEAERIRDKVNDVAGFAGYAEVVSYVNRPKKYDFPVTVRRGEPATA